MHFDGPSLASDYRAVSWQYYDLACEETKGIYILIIPIDNEVGLNYPVYQRRPSMSGSI